MCIVSDCDNRSRPGHDYCEECAQDYFDTACVDLRPRVDRHEAQDAQGHDQENMRVVGIVITGFIFLAIWSFLFGGIR